MTKYSVGGESHKQDWSKEEDAVLIGNLAMLLLLTLVAGLYLFAWVG